MSVWIRFGLFTLTACILFCSLGVFAGQFGLPFAWVKLGVPAGLLYSFVLFRRLPDSQEFNHMAFNTAGSVALWVLS